MIDRGKHNLLGVQIAAVDYEAAVEAIVQAAKHQHSLTVSALAVHGVMTGVLDREHCYRLNQLDLLVPDGQPVRWGLNLLHGTDLQDRVYGPQLTLRVCEAAAEQGLPIFLFGGKQETLDRLAAKLCERYPKLQIAGKQASLFRSLSLQERDELVERIYESGARITLVGIGCPRQEVWIYEFKEHLAMPLLAVGAAFSFHAGQLDQAPPWMQKSGLEWFFRLLKEPTRLWRRYLLLNPAYLSLLACQYLRLRTLKPSRGAKPKGEMLYG